MTKKEKQRMIDLRIKAHEAKYNRKLTDDEARMFAWYDRSDAKANGLTQCALEFLQWNGHQAERINTTGRRIDNTKVVTDVLGRKRQVGSVEWIKGTGTKGSADISATIKPTWSKFGVSIKIEVKIGKDRQSVHQKKYEQDINSAGGVYIIIKNLGDLMEWYDDFMNTPVS